MSPVKILGLPDISDIRGINYRLIHNHRFGRVAETIYGCQIDNRFETRSRVAVTLYRPVIFTGRIIPTPYQRLNRPCVDVNRNQGGFQRLDALFPGSGAVYRIIDKRIKGS